MAEIHAFRGLRYDLGHVGSLSDVVAPPYDVIDPALQDALYKKHPANVIRLILNREEPGDDDAHNRYTRAARFLKNWQSEGVLARDQQPALYVYHQVFSHQGREYTRRGFMGRLRLEPFGEGRVYPHEETHASAKADRLKLTLACRTNLSQIFGLYPDPDNAAQDRLEAAIADHTPLEAVDHLGVTHRMWMVTDSRAVAEVGALLGPLPIFIADGHHRYETACNYRRLLQEQGPLDAGHAANFVLMMCVGMHDPGLIVMPTHRLFRGLPNLTAAELRGKLGACFDCQPAGHGPSAAAALWEEIEIEGRQDVLGLYTQADGVWTKAQLTAAGRARQAEAAKDHGADWQGLGVAILHRLVVDTLLAAPNVPKPKYAHLIEEVVEGLRDGDPEGGAFPLAALVAPATVEHIRAVSTAGERMPAKSTYFHPKLLSGLVFHPLT